MANLVEAQCGNCSYFKVYEPQRPAVKIDEEGLKGVCFNPASPLFERVTYEYNDPGLIVTMLGSSGIKMAKSLIGRTCFKPENYMDYISLV
jgi:hypothetical protein